MSSEPAWRRIADWKAEVVLARLEDLDPDWLDAQGWTSPVEALRPRFPRLAALLEQGGLVRLDPRVLADLRARGVPTIEVGYHRGSDGLRYAEQGPEERFDEELDVAELAAAVANEAGGGAEQDDLPINDGVDALLRVLSEGLVTERAVLLAALAPPVGPPGDPPWDGLALAAHEVLEPSALPEASEATVEAFARALAARGPASPQPALTLDQRRRHVRRAGAIGALTVLLVGGLLPFSPMAAVVGAPIIVLCLFIIVIHTLAR